MEKNIEKKIHEKYKFYNVQRNAQGQAALTTHINVWQWSI